MGVGSWFWETGSKLADLTPSPCGCFWGERRGSQPGTGPVCVSNVARGAGCPRAGDGGLSRLCFTTGQDQTRSPKFVENGRRHEGEAERNGGPSRDAGDSVLEQDARDCRRMETFGWLEAESEVQPAAQPPASGRYEKPRCLQPAQLWLWGRGSWWW